MSCWALKWLLAPCPLSIVIHGLLAIVNFSQAHACSEGKCYFLLSLQVATRRTRTAGKVEIPNVDDHVSKLEHMGKETVKKLQDIKGSAVQSGIDINVPDNRIDKGEQSIVLLPDV